MHVTPVSPLEISTSCLSLPDVRSDRDSKISVKNCLNLVNLSIVEQTDDGPIHFRLEIFLFLFECLFNLRSCFANAKIHTSTFFD